MVLKTLDFIEIVNDAMLTCEIYCPVFSSNTQILKHFHSKVICSVFRDYYKKCRIVLFFRSIDQHNLFYFQYSVIRISTNMTRKISQGHFMVLVQQTLYDKHRYFSRISLVLLTCPDISCFSLTCHLLS